MNVSLNTNKHLILDASSLVEVGRRPTFETPFRDWTDKELTKQLAGDFSKFEDRDKEGFVTIKSLKKAANNPADLGLSWEDSMFAKELLNRSSLMDSLDKDGRGRLDGKIDEQNIQDVLNEKIDHPEVNLSNDLFPGVPWKQV